MILNNIHDSQLVVCLGVETPVRAFRHGRVRPITLTIPPGGAVDVGRTLGLDEPAAIAAVERSHDCSELMRKGYLRAGVIRADVVARSTPVPIVPVPVPAAVRAAVAAVMAPAPSPSMQQQVEAEAGAPVVLMEPSMDWTKQDLLAWAKARGVDVSGSGSKASIYRKIIGV